MRPGAGTTALYNRPRLYRLLLQLLHASVPLSPCSCCACRLAPARRRARAAATSTAPSGETQSTPWRPAQPSRCCFCVRKRCAVDDLLTGDVVNAVAPGTACQVPLFAAALLPAELRCCAPQPCKDLACPLAVPQLQQTVALCIVQEAYSLRSLSVHCRTCQPTGSAPRAAPRKSCLCPSSGRWRALLRTRGERPHCC